MTEQAVRSLKHHDNAIWQKVCRVMLEQALPINPFTTHPEESEPEDGEIFLSLESKEGTRPTREQFLERLRGAAEAHSPPRPLALVGPPGSGKTFLLNQLALWLLEKTAALPLWLSYPALGELTPRRYLLEKWLPRAGKGCSLPSGDGTDEFENLLESGRVWLFLDGVEDLSVLDEYHSGWASRARVVLAGRYRASALDSRYEVYRILPLSYPTEVKRFIARWFPRSGETLGPAIERFGPDRLRECLETPPSLALLCRLWQECHPNLPTTRAGLYRGLVRQFYRWQAENVPSDGEQRQQLERALGKAARVALRSNGILWERQLREVFEESPSLLSLALRLGWLTAVGTVGKNGGEKRYAFLDEAFQDYFAARAIEDWHFFLPELSEPDIPSSFPIFEEKWQRAILFWLGDEERTDGEKSAFLDALTRFPERCEPGNLYGKRAYFLAVAGLGEFDRHGRAEEILQQVSRWAFQDRHLPPPLVEAARNALGESDRERALDAVLNRLPDSGEIPKDLCRVLERIGSGHPRAIAALVARWEKAENAASKCQLAESLGRLEPGHPLALATPLEILDTADDDESRQVALSCLERVGKGDPGAIAAPARLWRTASPALARRTFACLEAIGRGNATAIATLVQLIRATRDPLVQCQAAESLERIDPGNPTAIAVLTRLMQTTRGEEIRQQTVYRLGEITPGNHEAVVALVNLIATSREEHTQWLAISSLGKIGAGDPLALDTLLKLVGATDRPLLRKESLDSLVKIAPDHPVCVQTLIAFLEAPGEDSLRWEAAKTLGRLDPGNPEAIAALSGFLRDANDDFTRRQAAASLGAIDPGNLEAILALVRLIRTGEDEGTRELAVESLGEIGTDNPAAIATLIRCLQKEREPKILRSAARSLGAIGRGHREAISSLLKLCQSNADEATRLQAVESLCLAVPPSGFGDIVRDLAGNWANSREKELSFPDRPDPIAQLLLWKCVHHLSYAEFYRAWHSPIRKNPAIVAANRHDFPALLHLLSRELPDGIRLLSVDSALFLDIEHPVVDIYDQMLAQNCPPFEHGIPETLSKLRLYWNQLRRERGDTLPIWVFYDNPLQPRGFSDDFLAALSKFPGDICLVTRRESDFPVTFSPDDPRAIVQWIRENSRRGT